MKLTKILIIITILIFSLQSLAKADDIRDFEIEGMSIGDSLLDFFTLEEIKRLQSVIFKDFEKRLIKIDTGSYENVVAIYKKNDPKYIIKGLTGNLGFYSGIEKCYIKMDSIQKEISSLFTNLTKKNWGILELDEPHQTYKPITYDFKNEDRIQISCWDFRINKEKDNDRDLLKFSLYSSAFREASSSEAIKK